MHWWRDSRVHTNQLEGRTLGQPAPLMASRVNVRCIRIRRLIDVLCRLAASLAVTVVFEEAYEGSLAVTRLVLWLGKEVVGLGVGPVLASLLVVG